MTTTAITVPSTTISNRRRKRSNRSRTNNSSISALPKQVSGYLATLTDPFEYGAIRVGFGTLVPTGLGTAYQRNNFTANSDGSFAIGVFPSTGSAPSSHNPICFNVGGASSSGWSAVQWINTTAIFNTISTCRVISCGLKVYPQVPATSAPGTLFAGSLPSAQYNVTFGDTTGLSTPNQLASSPYLKVGYGATGAAATSRPEDIAAFMFNTALQQGNGNVFLGASTTPPNSAPMIVGTGFPGSCLVNYEVVMNFEYTYPTFSSTTMLEQPLSGSSQSNESLSDLFPSLESMWTRIKPLLPDSSVVSSITDSLDGAAAAAVSAAAGTMTARASTGSTGLRRPHTAAMRALMAGGANLLSSVGRGLLDGYFNSMSGSGSATRPRLMASTD